jgi:hypothetical protein
MNKIVRNILAVLAGAILGSVINMGIIMISSSIIPPPEGVDTSNMESLKANMHLFQPKHFIMPFLAHAIGTLIGAFIAALIAANHKMTFAIVIGIFFLIGGIMSVFMLPSPIWFIILDLVVAYIPMAWIGGKLTMGFTKPQ